MTILDIGILATLMVAAMADLFCACLLNPVRPAPRSRAHPVRTERPLRR